MKVKVDYSRCISNIASSIMKYFELDYFHNTLSEVDEILNKDNPKNVIIILFDGMGDNILLNNLDEKDFLIKKRIGRITSVYPPTTTAAITSLSSGLNPSEHGYLGYNTYIKKLDKIITLFRSCEYGKKKSDPDIEKTINEELGYKTIVEQINEIGKYEAHRISEFGDIYASNLEEMKLEAISLCKKDGKKFIYIYDHEPDYTMHDFGPNSLEVKELIKKRNDMVASLADQIEDSLIIVTADHGQVLIDNIFLDDYPDLLALLSHPTSIESRTVSFRVKQDKKEEFERLFIKYFNEDFDLLSKKEVLDIKLFAEGNYHKNFIDSIGDYLAISKNNKALCLKEAYVPISHHAGNSDDEIYIPLIIERKK